MISLSMLLLGVIEESFHRHCPDTVLHPTHSLTFCAKQTCAFLCMSSAGRLQKSCGMSSGTSKHGHPLAFQNQRGYHRKSALLVSAVRGTTFPDGNENVPMQLRKKKNVMFFLGEKEPGRLVSVHASQRF